MLSWVIRRESGIKILCISPSSKVFLDWNFSLQEVRLMKLVQHPNVVRLYEVSNKYWTILNKYWTLLNRYWTLLNKYWTYTFKQNILNKYISKTFDCVAHLMKCNQSNQVQGVRKPINCREKISHLWQLKGASRYPPKGAKQFIHLFHLSLQDFQDASLMCTLFQSKDSRKLNLKDFKDFMCFCF